MPRSSICLLLIATLAPPAFAEAFLKSYETETGALMRPAEDIVLGRLRSPEGGEISSAEPLWVRVSDLPLELPHGHYILDRGDGSVEDIDLSEDESEYWLEASYKPGPYGLFTRAGQLYRTDGMALRPARDISAAMRQRWPFYEAGTFVPAPPPDITAEMRAQALDQVRGTFEADLAYLREKLGDGDLWALPSAERIALLDLASTRMAQAADAFAASGTAKDAERLFTTAVEVSDRGFAQLTADLVRSAVAIEARKNVLAKGMGAFMFQVHVETGASVLPEVILAMAQQGYRPALIYLLEHLPHETFPEDWGPWERLNGLRIVQRYDAEPIRDLAWQILLAQADRTVALASGEDPPSPEVDLPLPSAAVPAFLYLAAIGAGADELALPISEVNNDFIALAPALAEPDRLLDLFVDIEGGLSHVKMAKMVCPMIDGRRPDPGLLDRVHAVFLDHAVRIDHIRPEWYATQIVEDGLTHCLIRSSRLTMADGTSEDAARFFPAPWRYAVAGLPNALEATLKGPLGYVDHRLVDAAPALWVEAALEGRDSDTGVELYRSFRRLATTLGSFEATPYTGDAVRRRFLRPLREATEADRKVFMSGELSLYARPNAANNSLLVGLTLETVGRGGGLAGAFARDAEVIAFNMQDGSRGMIDRVGFRNDDVTTNLTFVQTVENGLHVFELPAADVDPANAVVDVYLSTKALDGTRMHDWVVSFPLWNSPLGYQHRVEFGEMSFAFQE